MGIKVGSEDIAAAYLGSTALAKICVGDEEVWPREFALTYIDAASLGSDTDVFDFGNFTIPRPGLVVAMVGVGSNGVTEVSIGGVAGTIFNPGLRTGAGYREVSAGDVNVTVTISDALGTGSICGVGVWLIEFPVSAALSDSDAPGAGGADTGTANLDELLGGASLYVLYLASDKTVSWSAATEQGHEVVNGRAVVFAHKEPTAAGNRTETASWSGNTTRRMIGLHWQ